MIIIIIIIIIIINIITIQLHCEGNVMKLQLIFIAIFTRKWSLFYYLNNICWSQIHK